ncbi:hypothetical protein WJX79_002471 [Trebouxia sp. C0005]
MSAYTASRKASASNACWAASSSSHFSSSYACLLAQVTRVPQHDTCQRVCYDQAFVKNQPLGDSVYVPPHSGTRSKASIISCTLRASLAILGPSWTMKSSCQCQHHLSESSVGPALSSKFWVARAQQAWLEQLANHPIKTTAQAVDLTSLFILKACAYDVTVTILPQGMHCYSGSPQGLERERAILMQAELGAQKYLEDCQAVEVSEAQQRTAANPSNCQRNHIKAESQNKLGTMAVSAAGLCGFVRLELRTPSTRVGSALICLTLSAIVVDPWFHSDQASGIELMLPLVS